MPEAPLIQAVKTALASLDLTARPEPVVVGVSGGLDSTALLHLLIRLGVRCHAVHINYRLRGSESDEDAAFVATLCAGLNVELDVVPVPDNWASDAAGSSLQGRAREFRYVAFEQTARRIGASKIAVAHHVDDQAETILLRLFRGTGLTGAVGMRSTRPISAGSQIQLIRPFLDITRAELVEWMTGEGLPYRKDSANLDARFDRARLRSEILPAIRASFGDAAIRNVARFADQARSAIDTVVAERIRKDLEEARTGDAHTSLRVDALRSLDDGWRDVILLEAIKRWMPDAPERATVVREVAGLLDAQPGKKVAFGSSQAWRDRESIVFTTSAGNQDAFDRDVTPGREVELPSGVFLVETVPLDSLDAMRRDSNVEIADARLLDGRLTVGRWRAGDRFQPLGMMSHKKLSDFLTDERVEAHQKTNVLVLRRDDEIVWVVGYRLAHPFRITPDTEKAVKLTYVPR